MRARDRGTGPELGAARTLASGEQCYRISRLHESDGKPLSHQISMVPCSVCPALLLSDLSGSIFQMLETRYGHVIRHAEQRLIASEPTPEDLALLRLPRHAHVFEIDRRSYADNGRAVKYFVFVLDIVQYEFVSSMDAPATAT